MAYLGFPLSNAKALAILTAHFLPQEPTNFQKFLTGAVRFHMDGEYIERFSAGEIEMANAFSAVLRKDYRPAILTSEGHVYFYPMREQNNVFACAYVARGNCEDDEQEGLIQARKIMSAKFPDHPQLELVFKSMLMW